MGRLRQSTEKIQELLDKVELDTNPFEKGEGNNSAVLKGGNNQAIGKNSIAVGHRVTAEGDYSSAEGYSGSSQALIAKGFASHAEGEGTQSHGRNSHAEGEMGIAYGRGSHAEGKVTKAYGMYAHAEGSETESGFTDLSTGMVWGDQATHAEGYKTKAIDRYSHAEGYATIAGFNPDAERPTIKLNGEDTPNYDASSAAHAEGYKTRAFGFASHAEGKYTTASMESAHAEGLGTKASQQAAHSEGYNTEALGIASHAEGSETSAVGYNSHAEGARNEAVGDGSHVEGADNLAEKSYTHVEGRNNTASGELSHVEGEGNIASGVRSHVEGMQNEVTSLASHAEGARNKATGSASHVEGTDNRANGAKSHVEGFTNIANNEAEHAEGKFNKSNPNTIHSVGIGTSTSNRKNAHEIMQDGKHYIIGIGGYDGTNPNSSNDVATELTELSERIDNLPKGEDFDKQGNYPLLHVGTADDLAGRGESVPAEFGFRASGGKSIKDGRAYIKRIKGNSIVWNQLSTTAELNQSKTTESLPIGASIVQGHKYAIIYESSNARLYFYTKIDGSNKAITSSQDGKSWIFTSDYSATSAGSTNTGLWWFILSLNSATTYSAKNIRLIDITKAFPNDWQNINTIEEFNARVATLGVNMNAYNEGEVIHCNTESIKSVGDNAWDEQWESGRFSNMGIEESYSGKIRSKNFIPVLANVDYYYTSPISLNFSLYDKEYRCVGSWQGIKGQDWDIEHPIGEEQITFVAGTIRKFPRNVSFIKFSTWGNNLTTYNNDIMITLVHSGWKQDTDAGYQPYWQDTLPLPIIRTYFPDGMKKAGSAHDEIRFNKATQKWEYSKGRIKSVDLGTFDYTTGSTNLADSKRMRALTKISDAIIPSSNVQVANILCGSYIAVSASKNYLNSEGVGIDADGYLYVYDKEKQDAASFKAAMAGVILYYESNDWEWVALDEADQNFRDYYNVADFGTEMSQSEVPSANFSADIIYQFNAVDMIREHELEITELQNVIATMQAQLTSLINGGQ